MKPNHVVLFIGWVLGHCVRIAGQDMSEVFPALKTLPAPPSIREGMRVSYYGSVGDIPKDNYSKWTTNEGTWEYATAPSAHGYTQVDVLALSQGQAVLSVQAWQYADWTGPLVPIRGGQSGLIGYAGGGDWWIHPLVLAQIQEFYTDDLAALRMPYTLDGTVYRALRVQRVLPESRQAVVYDLDTGLLLFKNVAVQTANSTFVSQMYFKGTRQLPLVGGAAPVPSWLKPGLELDYSGTYTAYVYGTSPFNLPLEAVARIDRVGDRWFSYKQTTTLGGPAGNVSEALLVGGGGNIYLAPATLRGLQAGALLDIDPITDAHLQVAQKDSQVTLRVTVGSVSRSDLIFDVASGVMTGFGSLDSTDPLYALETRVDLVQMPQVNLGPPRLGFRREGNEIALICENAGTRQFMLETCHDAQSWRAVESLFEGQTWTNALRQECNCEWYRLRLAP